MATSRFLAREDGNLQTSSLTSSRSRVFRDLDLAFEAKPNGEIFVKKDAAAVKQAVKNLIMTNHFEKPFQPFFGGNIVTMLFELADSRTGTEVRRNIVNAIQSFEPRARIINVDVQSEPDLNSLRVTIEFQVVNSVEIVRFSTVISRIR